MFSRAGKRLHLFPRFSPVACFSRLANVYIFSRALHWLHVSQGWPMFTSFPRLCTGCIFSRLANVYIFTRALQRLRWIPRLEPVLRFCSLRNRKCRYWFNGINFVLVLIHSVETTLRIESMKTNNNYRYGIHRTPVSWTYGSAIPKGELVCSVLVWREQTSMTSLCCGRGYH